jgi:N-methylhydantoinase B
VTSIGAHEDGGDATLTADPFDLEIIASSFVSVGEEMFVTTQRTSQSTIVYEVLDFSVGITDRAGRLITQGNGVTLFLATLADAVQMILQKFPMDEIHRDDIFVLNDPYVGGGTHLSDVTIVMPVHVGDEVVAFTANKAHWTEVGGRDPGSVSTDATEIYQEGLQLPCVKLCERGVENQALIDLIRSNVRLPDMSIGDLYAQVASVRLASARVEQLYGRYGHELMTVAVEQMMRHSAEVSYRALRELTPGEYTAEDLLESSTGERVPIKVRVTVTEDRFVCDFTGTHPAVMGPTNCTRTGLKSATRVVFKALVDPHSPLTEGTFAPVELICPDGTVFTAARPMPVSLYWEVLGRASDLVWHAMAEAVPARASAGHFATTCADLISGHHDDSGELFILFEPNAGGWGASEGEDGERGLVNICDGETFMIPCEIVESRYGLHVDQYSFNIVDTGAGKWRGGEGVIRDYRIRGRDVVATGMVERAIYPAWGADGGHEGSPSAVEVIRSDGSVDSLSMQRRPVAVDDVVRIRSGGGGGWGDPLERDPAAVAGDVRNGFVTLEAAAETYGVLVDPQTFAVEGLTDRRTAHGGAA